MVVQQQREQGARRVIIPTVRVVQVCPPICVQTESSSFRRVVQQLTGRAQERARAPAAGLGPDQVINVETSDAGAHTRMPPLLLCGDADEDEGIAAPDELDRLGDCHTNLDRPRDCHPSSTRPSLGNPRDPDADPGSPDAGARHPRGPARSCPGSRIPDDTSAPRRLKRRASSPSHDYGYSSHPDFLAPFSTKRAPSPSPSSSSSSCSSSSDFHLPPLSPSDMIFPACLLHDPPPPHLCAFTPVPHHPSASPPSPSSPRDYHHVDDQQDLADLFLLFPP